MWATDRGSLLVEQDAETMMDMRKLTQIQGMKSKFHGEKKTILLNP